MCQQVVLMFAVLVFSYCGIKVNIFFPAIKTEWNTKKMKLDLMAEMERKTEKSAKYKNLNYVPIFLFSGQDKLTQCIKELSGTT